MIQLNMRHADEYGWLTLYYVSFVSILALCKTQLPLQVGYWVFAPPTKGDGCPAWPRLRSSPGTLLEAQPWVRAGIIALLQTLDTAARASWLFWLAVKPSCDRRSVTGILLHPKRRCIPGESSSEQQLLIQVSVQTEMRSSCSQTVVARYYRR